MSPIELQLIILDHIRFAPWRGPFPKLLKVLGLELCSVQTAAEIAKLIHDKNFIAELYGQLNFAMWCGSDGNWRIVDLVHLQTPRNVPRGFCSLCRMDELDDRTELVDAGGRTQAHPMCLPTLLKRREELIHE